MALFSSSKDYLFDVSITKLVSKYPDPIKDAVIYSVLSNTSFADNILAVHSNNFSTYADKYLVYGENYWVYGLPAGTTYTDYTKPEDIAEAIIDYSGDPLATLNSYSFDYGDYKFEGNKYIAENYNGEEIDYELSPPVVDVVGNVTTTTHELRTLIKIIGYYDKFDVIFRDEIKTTVETVTQDVTVEAYFGGTSDTVITEETTVIVTFLQHNSETGSDEYDYETTEITTTVVTDHVLDTKTTTVDTIVTSVTRPGTLYTEQGTFDTSKKTYKIIYSSLGKLHYWSYDTATAAYPELDTKLNIESDSPYYPTIPIRNNKVNVNTYAEDNIVRTGAKALGNKIKLNTDSITSDFTESNDMEWIEDVFISFALSTETTEQASLGYLFEYFSFLEHIQTYSKSTWIQLWYAIREDNESQGYDAEDMPFSSVEINDAEYRYKLEWAYANTTIHSGVIAEEGKYTKSISRGSYTSSDSYDFNWKIIVRKQISSSSYIQIEVHALRTGHTIVGRRTATIYKTANMSGCVVPLRSDLLKLFPPLTRSTILLDGLSFVVFSLQVVKTKWYQQSFFSNLITFAALIFAIPSGGVTLTWAAVFDLIIVAAIGFGLQLLGEAIGGVFGALLAAAAAIYIGINGIQGLGISPLPMADALLAGVNQLATGFNAMLQEDISVFTDEVSDFLVEAEERTNALKKAEEGLNDKSNDYLFNPLLVTRYTPYFMADESPSQFYTRALETNPGVLSLDAVGTWVDTMLELPKAPMYDPIPTTSKPIYGENYEQ